MAKLSFEKFRTEDFEDVAYFEPYYLKDFVALKPKKRLLISIMLLILLGFSSRLLVNSDFEAQKITAKAICSLHQKYGCSVDNNIIIYPDIATRISFSCLGADLVLMFIILSWGLTGFKRYGKRIIVFSSFLIIINIARLILFYPLSKRLGLDTIIKAHDIMYNYISGFIVIILFIIYAVMSVRDARRITIQEKKK